MEHPPKDLIGRLVGPFYWIDPQFKKKSKRAERDYISSFSKRAVSLDHIEHREAPDPECPIEFNQVLDKVYSYFKDDPLETKLLSVLIDESRSGKVGTSRGRAKAAGFSIKDKALKSYYYSLGRIMYSFCLLGYNRRCYYKSIQLIKGHHYSKMKRRGAELSGQ